MSLLQRTLLYLLLVAVPVAAGGVWLFATLIDRGIRYEIDEQLSSDLLAVQRQLETARTVPNTALWLRKPHIDVRPATHRTKPVFTDTVEIDPRENERVPVRRLTATVAAGGQWYRVVVKQAMGEFEEISRLVSVSVAGGFLLLLILLTGLNNWVSGRLWRPFYTLMGQLRHYRLDASTPATFSRSGTKELDQLSQALNEMSRSLHRQYTLQASFTDHATHEMQTPLAVITAQLDRLLTTQPLTDEQVAQLEQVQASVRRLANLNKSLLLLTKIDNHQFAGQERVDLSGLLKRLHDAFEPFATHRRLGWTAQLDPGIYQLINPYLAEVLLSNLLKNALIHAQPDTTVTVALTPGHVQTINAGPPLPFSEAQLFDRFVKNTARSESTGLGLALVKQIAERYGMAVRYAYDEVSQQHTFTVQL